MSNQLPDQSKRPERGSRWRHPDFRGTWRVRSVGPRWVVLLAPYPIHGYPNSHSVPRVSWPDGWASAASDEEGQSNG